MIALKDGFTPQKVTISGYNMWLKVTNTISEAIFKKYDNLVRFF